MAYITQGFLCKLRRSMFDGMQDLPIKYFDTHKHGDIMSYYTNDIDTLRQLVSQALPSLISSGAIVVCVLGIMLWYSVWMTLLVLCGRRAYVPRLEEDRRRVGEVLRQAAEVGRTRGGLYSGNDERSEGRQGLLLMSRRASRAFDEINEALYEDGYRANAYANMLGTDSS